MSRAPWIRAAWALATAVVLAPLGSVAQTPPASGAGASSAIGTSDAAVLDGLQRQGADLGRPHTPVYAAQFPTESALKAARRDLENDGFRALRASPSKDGRTWMLLLTRTMPLTPDNVASASRSIEAIATRHGGHYNGWRAEPRK
jgi:hypothetical protein